MGVAALPVSRRGSLADTSGFLEDRSSRAGTPAGDDSETNFPILHRRGGSISEGSSIPLKRMDPKANGAHPQMVSQWETAACSTSQADLTYSAPSRSCYNTTSTWQMRSSLACASGRGGRSPTKTGETQ